VFGDGRLGYYLGKSPHTRRRDRQFAGFSELGPTVRDQHLHRNLARVIPPTLRSCTAYTTHEFLLLSPTITNSSPAHNVASAGTSRAVFSQQWPATRVERAESGQSTAKPELLYIRRAVTTVRN
jgi:hypothetical protein